MAPNNWGFPSLTEDYSTKEHLKTLKDLVTETYKNSKYIKPIAAIESIGAAALCDVGLTFFRALERVHKVYWNVSLAYHNRKYYASKILKKLEKEK